MSYNEPPNYGTPPPPPPGGGYGGPEQPYGQQPGYGGQPQQTSVLAIISLVTGILGLLCCGSFVFSVAALILGFLGKKEIDEGHKTGKGMALAGLILGAIGVVLSLIWIILVFADAVSFNAYSDL
ncbi:DUF4190 domain-containing protein [Nocardioides sp. zg-536]|uniref:DUF4190 domain-containing protein n=1 Tax=Nocardioides faecalis TaxID=2803858 RepID=A0A938Y1M5_9ACTN|nr:DUF4190 domain-containing protein [Nocardioides faecalis]MBM9460517.1 DUF4190 domain-containing protein [Nocardioides faecalis]MBS4754420.1 DUF4190 domain-containing protein [Nocardioides faecalis]QVI57550.1 DUF4190 domain-containing protein [Nocardioides faecalis]